MSKTFAEFQTETAARFEQIYLIPLAWMDVSEADLRIAFSTGDTPKGFAITLGVANMLRPSLPD